MIIRHPSESSVQSGEGGAQGGASEGVASAGVACKFVQTQQRRAPSLLTCATLFNIFTES